MVPIVGSVAASTLGATKENGEPDHAGNPGGTSVWWRYENPVGARGDVELDPAFSCIDTLLAVYTGARVNDRTLIAENDNESATTTSRLMFYAKPAASTTFTLQ